jgi:hypothetical protein
VIALIKYDNSPPEEGWLPKADGVVDGFLIKDAL